MLAERDAVTNALLDRIVDDELELQALPGALPCLDQGDDAPLEAEDAGAQPSIQRSQARQQPEARENVVPLTEVAAIAAETEIVPQRRDLVSDLPSNAPVVVS